MSSNKPKEKRIFTYYCKETGAETKTAFAVDYKEAINSGRFTTKKPVEKPVENPLDFNEDDLLEDETVTEIENTESENIEKGELDKGLEEIYSMNTAKIKKFIEDNKIEVPKNFDELNLPEKREAVISIVSEMNNKD